MVLDGDCIAKEHTRSHYAKSHVMLNRQVSRRDATRPNQSINQSVNQTNKNTCVAEFATKNMLDYDPKHNNRVFEIRTLRGRTGALDALTKGLSGAQPCHFPLVELQRLLPPRKPTQPRRGAIFRACVVEVNRSTHYASV